MAKQIITNYTIQISPIVIFLFGCIGTLLTYIWESRFRDYSRRIFSLENKNEINKDCIAICRMEIKDIGGDLKTRIAICEKEHK